MAPRIENERDGDNATGKQGGAPGKYPVTSSPHPHSPPRQLIERQRPNPSPLAAPFPSRDVGPKPRRRDHDPRPRGRTTTMTTTTHDPRPPGPTTRPRGRMTTAPTSKTKRDGNNAARKREGEAPGEPRTADEGTGPVAQVSTQPPCQPPRHLTPPQTPDRPAGQQTRTERKREAPHHLAPPLLEGCGRKTTTTDERRRRTRPPRHPRGPHASKTTAMYPRGHHASKTTAMSPARPPRVEHDRHITSVAPTRRKRNATATTRHENETEGPQVGTPSNYARFATLTAQLDTRTGTEREREPSPPVTPANAIAR